MRVRPGLRRGASRSGVAERPGLTCRLGGTWSGGGSWTGRRGRRAGALRGGEAGDRGARAMLHRSVAAAPGSMGRRGAEDPGRGAGQPKQARQPVSGTRGPASRRRAGPRRDRDGSLGVPEPGDEAGAGAAGPGAAAFAP